jgi:hypothetical protein
VLVEEAWRAGGARIDPVVREQLLTSMRATRGEDGGEDDAALLERALALGLHRADPVTRQRLAFQAEQLLTARVASEQPGDAVLDAYLRAHRARYALPQRVSFVQVFVSSGRHGAQLAADAARLLSDLRSRAEEPRPSTPPAVRGRVDADAVAALGDPSLFPHRFTAVDAVAVDAQLGAGFAEALWRGQLGQWAGPIPSAYGQHLVLLEERIDGRLPALDELRERVLADYRHDRRRELLRERLHALRSSYRVELRSPRS